MTEQPLAADTAPSPPVDFLPLTADRVGWRNLIAPLLSGVMLVAALAQLRDIDFAEMLQLMPRSVGAWLLFGLGYLAMPASEWLIYRRLWRLPEAGLVPLLRKQITNDILIGYGGDLYFYGWARRHVALAAAPFGAVKDVAMISAAVGNFAALVLLAAAWPLLSALQFGVAANALSLSATLIALSSLAMLVFRRALFALPAADLRYILLVTVARVGAILLLTALLWRAVLPAAPFGW